MTELLTVLPTAAHPLMQWAGILLLCAPVLHLVKWPPALGTQHQVNNLFTSLHLKPLQIWQNMTWRCPFCAHIWNSFWTRLMATCHFAWCPDRFPERQRCRGLKSRLFKKTYIFWRLFSVKNECVRADQYFTSSKYGYKWFHRASTPLKLLYAHAEKLVQTF